MTMRDNTQRSAPSAQQDDRGDVMASGCPSREILRHVTSLWGVLVLVALTEDTYRFGALRRTIGGVSERMLAQTLRLLEQDGLVKRKAYDVIPPHVEYSLTPPGREAAARVAELTDWIERHYETLTSEQTA